MKLALAVAVFVTSFTAFAQGKAAPTAPSPNKPPAEMPMPQMPVEGKKWLEGHLGKWKSKDVMMTMGDKTMKGTMDLDCEKTSSGWGTLCKGKMDLGKDMPPQEVTFLMGWNIGDGEATMFEVTNMGEVHHHKGAWTDANSITVTHEGKTPEGKMEKDAATFTWKSPKEIAIMAVGTSGTTTNWKMTATAKK